MAPGALQNETTASDNCSNQVLTNSIL